MTATNDSGVDTNSVDVIVLGKPFVPKGPLTVSNVLADNVTLNWKAPLDVIILKKYFI